MTDETGSLLNEIESAEMECRTAETHYLDLKQQTKEAKEEYEQAVYTLRRLASARINDQDRPLINRDDED